MGNKYFYISGIGASFLYFLCFFLFFIYLKDSSVKRVDAVSKETVLELNLIESPKEDKENIKTTIKKSDEPKSSTSIAEKSTSTSVKKRASIKNIFSKVETKAIEVAKEDVLNVKESLTTSRFKSKFEKERKSSSVDTNELLNTTIKKSSISLPNSVTKESDEYYSKVNEILYKRWKPVILSKDLSARVLVFITNLGKFDYKFLNYSGNEQFDKSLQDFLESQKFVEYPTHDKGLQTTIEITFKSKG